MLRIYCLQQWFNLSDPAAEEALYDSLSMLRFVGIDLGRKPVPDETTICRFRHLLETHDFGKQTIFGATYFQQPHLDELFKTYFTDARFKVVGMEPLLGIAFQDVQDASPYVVYSFIHR